MSKSKTTPAKVNPEDAARAVYIEAGLPPASVDAILAAERDRVAQGETATGEIEEIAAAPTTTPQLATKLSLISPPPH